MTFFYHFRQLGVTTLFTLCLGSLSTATTYYVATTGSDANQGTSSSPLATIQHGLSLAQAGDTVIVEDGRYGANQAFTITKGGTSSAWITIKAQNKGGAVLDGEMQADTYFQCQSGAQFLSIEDFDINSTTGNGILCNGGTHGTAHDILIKGNHIHNVGNINSTTDSAMTGVYIGPPTYNFSFDGNEFDHIGRLSSSGTNAYNHDHALYIEGTAVSVKNNLFHDNTAGWDIQFATGMGKVSVLNNTFYGANPHRDGQIELWGGMNNLIIQNNIFYSPRNYAVDVYQATLNNVTIDHNIVCCSNVGLVANTSGLAVTNNKVNLDPLFANGAGSDFHLQAGSPAIDAGATEPSVTADYDNQPRPQGGGYEIGAFEYSGSLGAPTPSPAPTPDPTPTPSPAPTPAPTPTPDPTPTPAPTPAGSGPTAYWKLSDGKGTLAQDSSGNNNAGTITATPTWATVATGYALEFDGSKQYVAVNENVSLEESSALTVALWVSPQLNPTGDQRLISKIWSWDIKLNGSRMRPQFTSGGKSAEMNYAATAGQWQQVVFTFRSGTVKAYVNGVPVQLVQNTFTGSEVLPLQKAGLYIGTDASRTYFARGTMDEVRIYNRVLSDSEVATLYSQSLQ